jgi:hypothetical protein
VNGIELRNLCIYRILPKACAYLKATPMSRYRRVHGDGTRRTGTGCSGSAILRDHPSRFGIRWIDIGTGEWADIATLEGGGVAMIETPAGGSWAAVIVRGD